MQQSQRDDWEAAHNAATFRLDDPAASTRQTHAIIQLSLFLVTPLPMGVGRKVRQMHMSGVQPDRLEIRQKSSSRTSRLAMATSPDDSTRGSRGSGDVCNYLSISRHLGGVSKHALGRPPICSCFQCAPTRA